MQKLVDKKLLSFLNKNQNKRVVLCHGVFDLVHYGHIQHFKSAKKYGDILIVSITKDKFIKKGFNRPLFNEIKRIEYLNEITLIDYIYVCESESAADSIKTINRIFMSKDLIIKIINWIKQKNIFREKISRKK